jgi:HD-GYP domain-containing protein (c-di-GMP phosphodiesterase class II)
MTAQEDYGLSPVFQKKIRGGYGEKIARIIFQKQKPFLVNPNAMVLLGLEEVAEEEKGASSIYMPLTVRGKNSGILYLSRSERKDPFTPSEVELVSVLSGQAAVAIENAHLYKKLEQSYLSTIVTLSSVAEGRDQYTDRHMKDIAEYSVKIATKQGLSESYIEDIRKAALLHDLGKVTVPDNILMKKGKLTEEEMAIIKKHPLEGVRMIEFIEPLGTAKEIIKHHHEFFDGSGYPDGLRGDQIPVGARIVAIADAFGAMTTDRPYRKALSVDEAVKELRENAGSQFDPEFVDIFISILQEQHILKQVST